MCFSASASFTAGAVLTVIGAVAIKKAKKPSEIPFASIPLLFALQQITEGFVWLSLTNPDYAFMEEFSTHTFIFFAQVVWPIWIPFSFLKFEKNEDSNITGKILVGLGVLLGVVMGYYLFTKPVEAEILGSHISYNQNYPDRFRLLGGIIYVIVTIAPPFTSSVKKMWVLGSAIFLSYIFTEIYYTQYVVSVWCYFASVLSALILWIIAGDGKKINN